MTYDYTIISENVQMIIIIIILRIRRHIMSQNNIFTIENNYNFTRIRLIKYFLVVYRPKCFTFSVLLLLLNLSYTGLWISLTCTVRGIHVLFERERALVRSRSRICEITIDCKKQITLPQSKNIINNNCKIFF